MATGRREHDLDLFRCAAVLLIVLLHAWGAASQYAVPGSLELKAWTFLSAVCTNAALPALFLVSGHLLFRGFALANWPSKMLRRVKRLLVPSVCWNASFVLFYLVCGHFFPRVGARVTDFGLTTGLGCLAKILHPSVQPIDVPVWFMRTIFAYALFSPVLWLFLRHRIGRWACLAAVLAYTLACELKVLPETPGYPAYALLAFVVGGLIAVVRLSIADVFRSHWWILPGVLALGWGFCNAFGFPVPRNWTLRALLMTPLFFWLLLRVQPFLRFPLPRPDVVFFLYAGHFLFCSVWVHALAPMTASLGTGRLTVLIALFLVPGLALLFAVHRLGKRLCPKAIRLFDGSL